MCIRDRTKSGAVKVPPVVTVPLTSKFPLTSIVVALSSISVSETKSKTPSADWWINVPLSPNCNWSVADKSNPVSATWVKVTSWSLPNWIVPPSARNKSDHSNEAEPNACPSALEGVFALKVVNDKTPEPSVISAWPEEPSASGNWYATEAVRLPTVNPE